MKNCIASSGVTPTMDSIHKQFRQIKYELSKEMECSICLELLTEPVITKCKHQFCKKCLKTVLEKIDVKKCPMCNEILTKRSMFESAVLMPVLRDFNFLCEAMENDLYQRDIQMVSGSLQSPQSVNQNSKAVPAREKKNAAVCKNLEIAPTILKEGSRKKGSIKLNGTEELESTNENSVNVVQPSNESNPVQGKQDLEKLDFQEIASFCDQDDESVNESEQSTVELPHESEPKRLVVRSVDKVENWLANQCSKAENEQSTSSCNSSSKLDTSAIEKDRRKIFKSRLFSRVEDTDAGLTDEGKLDDPYHFISSQREYPKQTKKKRKREGRSRKTSLGMKSAKKSCVETRGKISSINKIPSKTTKAESVRTKVQEMKEGMTIFTDKIPLKTAKVEAVQEVPKCDAQLLSQPFPSSCLVNIHDSFDEFVNKGINNKIMTKPSIKSALAEVDDSSNVFLTPAFNDEQAEEEKENISKHMTHPRYKSTGRDGISNKMENKTGFDDSVNVFLTPAFEDVLPEREKESLSKQKTRPRRKSTSRDRKTIQLENKIALNVMRCEIMQAESHKLCIERSKPNLQSNLCLKLKNPNLSGENLEKTATLEPKSKCVSNIDDTSIKPRQSRVELHLGDTETVPGIPKKLALEITKSNSAAVTPGILKRKVSTSFVAEVREGAKKQVIEIQKDAPIAAKVMEKDEGKQIPENSAINNVILKRKVKVTPKRGEKRVLETWVVSSPKKVVMSLNVPKCDEERCGEVEKITPATPRMPKRKVLVPVSDENGGNRQLSEENEGGLDVSRVLKKSPLSLNKKTKKENTDKKVVMNPSTTLILKQRISLETQENTRLLEMDEAFPVVSDEQEKSEKEVSNDLIVSHRPKRKVPPPFYNKGKWDKNRYGSVPNTLGNECTNMANGEITFELSVAEVNVAEPEEQVACNIEQSAKIQSPGSVVQNTLIVPNIAMEEVASEVLAISMDQDSPTVHEVQVTTMPEVLHVERRGSMLFPFIKLGALYRRHAIIANSVECQTDSNEESSMAVLWQHCHSTGSGIKSCLLPPIDTKNPANFSSQTSNPQEENNTVNVLESRMSKTGDELDIIPSSQETPAIDAELIGLYSMHTPRSTNKIETLEIGDISQTLDSNILALDMEVQTTEYFCEAPSTKFIKTENGLSLETEVPETCSQDDIAPSNASEFLAWNTEIQATGYFRLVSLRERKEMEGTLHQDDVVAENVDDKSPVGVKDSPEIPEVVDEMECTLPQDDVVAENADDEIPVGVKESPKISEEFSADDAENLAGTQTSTIEDIVPPTPRKKRVSGQLTLTPGTAKPFLKTSRRRFTPLKMANYSNKRAHVDARDEAENQAPALNNERPELVNNDGFPKDTDSQLENVMQSITLDLELPKNDLAVGDETPEVNPERMETNFLDISETNEIVTYKNTFKEIPSHRNTGKIAEYDCTIRQNITESEEMKVPSTSHNPEKNQLEIRSQTKSKINKNPGNVEEVKSLDWDDFGNNEDFSEVLFKADEDSNRTATAGLSFSTSTMEKSQLTNIPNTQVRERLKLDIESDKRRLEEIEKLLEDQNRDDVVVLGSESEEERDMVPKFQPRAKAIDNFDFDSDDGLEEIMLADEASIVETDSRLNESPPKAQPNTNNLNKSNAELAAEGFDDYNWEDINSSDFEDKLCDKHKSQSQRKRSQRFQEAVRPNLMNSPRESTSKFSPQRYSLVVSGCSASEMNNVQLLAQQLKGSFQRNFTDTTSHVVVKLVGNLCVRTLKYILGISAKRWIVNYKWVIDSLKAGKAMPEENYEVVGDTNDGLHNGPRKARTSTENPLLSDYEICLINPFTEVTKDQIKLILNYTGATFVHNPVNFTLDSERKKLIICENQFHTRNEFEDIIHKYNVDVVSRDWLLDSTASYTIQPTRSYAIK